MTEHMSSILQILRSEFTAGRQRREADRAGMALLIAGEKLVLRQRRASLLAPASAPEPVASPSQSQLSAPSLTPVTLRMSLGAWSGGHSWFPHQET
jgi:hypothetical protein